MTAGSPDAVILPSVPAAVDAAVNAAHTAFDLGTDEVQAVVYGGTGR